MQLYKYLQELQPDTEENEIQRNLMEISKSKHVGYLRYIEQLLYCEQQFYGA